MFDGKKTETVSFSASEALVRALDELAADSEHSRSYHARRLVEEGLRSVGTDSAEAGVGGSAGGDRDLPD